MRASVVVFPDLETLFCSPFTRLHDAEMKWHHGFKQNGAFDIAKKQLWLLQKSSSGGTK